MTRTGDDNVPLSKRAEIAKDNKADLFLSIHHNATADPDVNFPIIYYHGNASENKASVIFGKHIGEALSQHLYEGQTPVSIVSDHTIFPNNGTAVLRESYGIPGVIAEASFFTNPAEEGRLRSTEHNLKEALGYLRAMEAFFQTETGTIVEKNSRVSIPPLQVFQESERMNETALLWYQDYLRGKEIMQETDATSLRKAYDLFTRSVRSFPDSHIAAECHKNRALILRKLGKPEEAEQETARVREHFVPTGQLQLVLPKKN